ncbi:glycosyltransferase family 39 protein [Micromonospora rifamycinica]|uniref:glycosyltransferase family 39 protein n=1 Tax=Micromonospora rifamycinica TaxID=291594 RepID=UPI002E29715F|nr:glycosyltransferase family 39 protein [Micromonospora rifamycinica]
MSVKRHSAGSARALVWLVPLLATLLVGGYGIGRAQLWRDELATWSAATRPVGDLLRLTRTIDAASGPYYLSVHAWTGLSGDSEAALRLPSVLAMAAAAGLTAALGRRLFGSAAGLLAGLLFAVLPGTSRYAQEARPYALVTLLAVLATVLLVRALDRPGRWRWAGYAAAVAGLGLAHLLALGLVAAHAVVVLTGRPPADPGQPGGGTPGRRWRDRRSAGWALAVLVAALPLVPLLVTAAGQRSHQLDWIAPARPADLAALPGGLAQSGVVGGMLVGLAALGAARSGRRGLLPGACALLPVLLLFVAALAVPLWVPRYLFFTVPFGCLLAGAALAGPTPAARPSPGPPEVAGPPPTRWRPATGAGLAVVALAGLLGLPDQAAVRHGHGWPRSATVDYRGAAAVIAAGQRPGDAVVYAPRDGWLFLDLGVDYHLARTAGDPAGGVHPRDVLVTEGRRERADLWVGECARPAECLAGVDRVWLVVAGRRDDPLAAVPGARGEALRAGFAVAQVRPRPGVTVALLVRRG